MSRFKQFADKMKIIDDIKTHLYKSDDYDDWEEFVDNQSIGDCQEIVSNIVRHFPSVKKIFGEIKVDEPYIDEYGDEQNLMTHHWVEIDNEQYDFSKGTLKDYIDFVDIYDPNIEDDSIYHNF